MFRRSLVLIGTTTLSLIALLGLIWFASSSFSIAHAKSPAIHTANTVLPRPLNQVPPGCTPIGSDIAMNTIWPGSCYHIMTNTVTIYAGVSLVIDPPGTGTWIYFEDGTQLQVLGDLQALGTPASPITFTAVHPPTPWVGIILEQDTGGDRIEYSVIEYAQTGVRINDEDAVTIQFNTLRHNRFGATGGGGIGGDTDDSTITNNTIYDCSNGIALNESFGNDISGNTIYDTDQYGVALVARTTVGGNENTINDNEIYDCDVNGIRLENGESNTVQGNTIYQCGSAGMVIDQQSSPLIQDNQVFNTAQDTGALTSILITNDSKNVELRANQIMSNGSGLGGYVAAVYVQTMSSDFNQLVVNDNVIHDTYGRGIYYAADNSEVQTVMQTNAICSVPSYELDNQRGGHTIDARYGWWGTNTPAAGVNYVGSVNLTPWITLSVTTVPTTVPGNLGSTVNVLVTMNDGAGHTVPDGARQVHLDSSSGTLNPSVVTLDGNGQAISTFTLTEMPPSDQITISATAFCDYVTTTILTVERTNVAIDKAVSVAQVIAGDQLVYQITYSNTTDVAATNVCITDSLPAGTTWAGDTATFSGWTPRSTSPQPIWCITVLPPGAYGSFVLTVDVPADATCGALLTNWVTIGTETIEETTTDNTASAGPVTVIQPSVVVTKTGDALSKIGDLVTYEFQITNNSCPASSPDLTLVSIVDTGIGWAGLGNLTSSASGCGSLSVGASCFFTVQRTAPVGAPDPMSDNVTVHYRPDGFTVDVSDSDTHAVNLFQPSITFDKSGDTLSKVGDDVNYALTLTNTSSSDTPGLVCTITDPMLGINQTVTLASGGSHVINATYTVPVGASDPLVNTAQVSCSPTGFPNVLTDSDSHSVNLFQPSITFDKSGDALSKVGDDVNYALTLTNTSSSDSPSLVCTITDPMLGINQSVTLASGGSRVINATYPVPAGASDPLVNTAQVSCSPTGFPNVLTDSATHSVDLFQPSIQVGKAGPALSYAGETIIYTFRITNTSSPDSPPLILDRITDVGSGWFGLGNLTGIALHDCSSLPVGASCSFAVQYTLLDCNTSPLINTVTARYRPWGFSNVISDSDSHAMAVQCAVDLVVEKDDDVGSTSPFLRALLLRVGLFEHPMQATQYRDFVGPGDLITYTVFVRNIGPVTATNIVLSDTLPDFTTYVGYGWQQVGATRDYTITVRDLPPGDIEAVFFVVRLDDPLPTTVRSIINDQACGSSAEPDLNYDDNCDLEDSPVRWVRLDVDKEANPLSVRPGEQVTYTITVTNLGQAIGDGTSSGITITDALPDGFTWVTDTAASAGLTRLSTQPPVWYMPAFPVGERISFTLVAQASLGIDCAPRVTNTVTASVTLGGQTYDWSATAEVSIPCAIDLLVVKDDNVGPTSLTSVNAGTRVTVNQLLRTAQVNAPSAPVQHRSFVREGDLVTYTVVVVNTGTSAVSNVTVSETLPLYTDYVGYGWIHLGGRTYITTAGTLLPGTVRVYYFVVRVYDTLPAGVDNLVNRVCGWGDEPDEYPEDNCNYEDTPIRRRPLQVIKVAEPCISPGDEFNYTITYQNISTGTTFYNVVLTDTLDPYVSYTIGQGWNCTGQICNQTIPVIPPGVSGTLQLPVQLSASLPATRMAFTNTVVISGGNRFVLVTLVDTGPDLSVLKNDNVGPLPLVQQAQWDDMRQRLSLNHQPASIQATQQREFVYPGELITYTILYVNSGQTTATNVVLTERLPDYTTYVGGGWTFAGGQQYTFNVGDLAPGQGGELHFIVRVSNFFPPDEDRVINRVDIAGQEAECNLTNNMSTDDTPVQPYPLHAIKTAPSVACQNDVINYTIVASNVITVAMPGVVLSDTIPNGTIYVPGSCRYQINAGPLQPCGPPPVLWQEDLAPGDRVTTTFAVTVTAGTMGWPIENCAVFNWGGRQIWACATTIVGRCDQRLYVANRDSGTVDVFDLNGFRYVDTIPMGINPFGMVMVGDFLFVVDFDEPSNRGRLYVVNTLLDQVVDSPLVGAHPIHIAAYDHHIYVASHSSQPAITVYDYVSGQVVAQPVLDRHLTYEFGFFGATTDESRGCVYLTKRDFGSIGIWQICPPSSSGPWTPEFVHGTSETNREKPSSTLYHPDLDRVYVTFGLIDELWAFDPETWQLLERIPTGVQDPTDPGYGGHGLASLGQCVFVANYIGQSVTAVVDGSCVDTTSVMATPPEPSTSRAHRVYLPLLIKNYGTGQQSPQQQRIVTIPVSGRPKGMVAGAGNLLFVTLPEDGSGNPLNRIAVIDTETLQVIDEIQSVGDHPHTVALRPVTVSGTRSDPSGTLLLP
jgi:uncharacterized repeat protein (TIGR01451 family)